MKRTIRARGALLYRRGENILAAMLGTMFAVFMLQIVFRYILNFPIGWTNEVSAILWVWLVLWGAAFVLREDEEIRFDLIFGFAGPRLRRTMAFLAAAGLLMLYASRCRQ